MTRKFPAASKLAMLLAAAALVALGSASASAQTKQQKYDRDGRPYYGANGPNRSYQQGPPARITARRANADYRRPSPNPLIRPARPMTCNRGA